MINFFKKKTPKWETSLKIDNFHKKYIYYKIN